MSKSDSSRRVHLIVPLQQYRKWEAESAKTGVTISELIRRAMSASLAKQASPK